MYNLKIIIILNLVLLHLLVEAQSYLTTNLPNYSNSKNQNPDTVIINFEDYATIVLSTKRIHELSGFENIDIILSEFVNDIEKIKDSFLDENRSYHFSYKYDNSENRTLKFEPKVENTQEFIYTGDNIKKIVHFSIKVFFDLKGSNIMVLYINTLSDLHRLKDNNLKELIYKIQQDISDEKIQKRKAVKCIYSYENRNINTKTNQTIKKNNNSILFNYGMGVQLLGNNAMPQMYLGLGFSPSYKNIYGDMHLISITTNQYLKDITEFGSNIEYYTFINYEWLWKWELSQNFYTGVSYGYIFIRKGDLFSDDTWRLATLVYYNKIKISFGVISSDGITLSFVGVYFNL